ncbi:MAG: TetR family transcriptional regulator [Acidimicrobiia bacterium]|nr:TetR family transcriptional regulator [Acidimicrobiia bacterium]
MDDAVDTAAAPRAEGGRRERSKRDKLARIVRAASVLFSERGFEATTTQAIAEQAGIGAGTLFLYVRSKDDLLVRVVLEALGRELDDASSTVPAEGAVAEQVLALFATLVAYLEEDSGLSRAFLKEVLFASDAERPAVQGMVDQFHGRLGHLVNGAKDRGEVAAEVSPSDLAANLFALFFHVLQLRHGGHLPATDVPARLRAAVELQLRACQPARRATK